MKGLCHLTHGSTVCLVRPQIVPRATVAFAEVLPWLPPTRSPSKTPAAAGVGGLAAPGLPLQQAWRSGCALGSLFFRNLLVGLFLGGFGRGGFGRLGCLRGLGLHDRCSSHGLRGGWRHDGSGSRGGRRCRCLCKRTCSAQTSHQYSEEFFHICAVSSNYLRSRRRAPLRSHDVTIAAAGAWASAGAEVFLIRIFRASSLGYTRRACACVGQAGPSRTGAFISGHLRPIPFNVSSHRMRRHEPFPTHQGSG